MAESWLTWPGYDELLGIFLYWTNSRKPGYQLFKIWCGSNLSKVLGMKRGKPKMFAGLAWPADWLSSRQPKPKLNSDF